MNLAFTSNSNRKYTASTRLGDRSGRLNMETFCVTPDVGRDLLEDYYGSGIWSNFGAGGLSAPDRVLGRKPLVIEEELNEWKTLPPGSYTLRVVSHRVDTPHSVSSGSIIGFVFVVSNPISFQVIAATPEWQARQLTLATSVLDRSHSTGVSVVLMEQAQHAARILRFLGSEAATRELARRFWPRIFEGDDWDFEAGLIASPHRQIAIQELNSAIEDPRRPVTHNLIETLALLEVQSIPEYKLPHYDASRKVEWEERRKAKVAAYDKIVTKLLQRTAAALDKKSGRARTITAETLSDKHPDFKEVPLWDPAAWWHEMTFTSKIALSSLTALFFLSGILGLQRLKQGRSAH
ncbi:MAG: hypothetical protein HY010_14910 [Acidobacteria bacterium]|nr:hypothetical protein [Acidobacteriota bacterium]